MSQYRPLTVVTHASLLSVPLFLSFPFFLLVQKHGVKEQGAKRKARHTFRRGGQICTFFVFSSPFSSSRAVVACDDAQICTAIPQVVLAAAVARFTEKECKRCNCHFTLASVACFPFFFSITPETLAHKLRRI